MNAILVIDYQLNIPTDSQELAELLLIHSRDWAENLLFLEKVARSRGVHIDTVLVSELIQEANSE